MVGACIQQNVVSVSVQGNGKDPVRGSCGDADLSIDNMKSCSRESADDLLMLVVDGKILSCQQIESNYCVDPQAEGLFKARQIDHNYRKVSGTNRSETHIRNGHIPGFQFFVQQREHAPASARAYPGGDSFAHNAGRGACIKHKIQVAQRADPALDDDGEVPHQRERDFIWQLTAACPGDEQQYQE